MREAPLALPREVLMPQAYVRRIRYGADPELVEHGRRTLARHRTTSRP
ncbi:hypothetical protein ACIRBY_25705 [Streptomyces sp. NPDC096136]